MRFAGLCAIWTTLLACCSGSANAGYIITELALPGTDWSEAYAINDRGEVVGTAWRPGGADRAFLYSGGTIVEIVMPGGASLSAWDINESSEVLVARTDPSTGGEESFLYNDNTGVFSRVGPSGGNSIAFAINDYGWTVGVWVDFSAGGYDAFVDAGGGVKYLFQPFDVDVVPRDVNNSGDVVGGYFDLASGSERSFLLPAGGPRIDLGIDGDSWAAGINENGDIVGWSSAHGAYHYDRSTRSVTYLGAGGDSMAYAINDSGDIVGSSHTLGAFLYGSSPIFMADLPFRWNFALSHVSLQA